MNAQTTEVKVLLNLSQLARRTDCDFATVARRLATGEIHATAKDGKGRPLFELDSVAALQRALRGEAVEFSA